MQTTQENGAKQGKIAEWRFELRDAIKTRVRLERESLSLTARSMDVHRERLGQRLLCWEAGRGFPDAEDMQWLWKLGFDLHYVLLGERDEALMCKASRDKIASTTGEKVAIGLRLLEERIRLGYENLAIAAEWFGVTKASLGSWERGESMPRADQLIAAVRHKEYDAHYVITGVRSNRAAKAVVGLQEWRTELHMNATQAWEMVGGRILMERRRLGMTLEQLAERVGVIASTIRKWESGDPLSGEYLYRLVGAGMNPGYLLLGTTLDPAVAGQV